MSRILFGYMGIFVSAIMIFGGITPVLSADASILQQYNDGVPVEELSCTNSSHVLVMRTNGKVACVSESMSEKKEWKIISNSTQIIYDNKNVDMHPCQRAALDYVKSYDPSTSQESLSSDNLVLMNNDLDCYDMQSMEPKDDWYTEEFKIQLKKELVKSFSK